VRRVTKKHIPDACEVRLLLGQEIGKYIEFACNVFFDLAIGGDREREIGFSTATSYAIHGEALKIGLETSYRNVSQQGERRNAKEHFRARPSSYCKTKPSHADRSGPPSLARRAIHLIWNSSPSFRMILGPVLSENRKVQPLEAADFNSGALAGFLGIMGSSKCWARSARVRSLAPVRIAT
jgi:hypothetical protein